MKKGDVKIKKEKSTKEWLPFENILENGIIQTQNSYVKILKIIPINYNLKSKLEKESILNSYKLFLKTCDFNIQILIQSKKESLSKMFFYLEEKSQKENKSIKELVQNYKEFLILKNNGNKASSKNFYIIIKADIREDSKNNSEEKNINSKILISKLLENYFKIKEALSRCGNLVFDLNNKEELVSIFCTFFTTQKNEKGE